MVDVVALMDATPELFIKLSKRDGLTRYRLSSAATALTPADVRALVMRSARYETWLLYAVILMVLCALFIIFLLMGPAL